MDWEGWAVFGLAATAALTSVLIAAQLAGWTRPNLPLLATLVVEDPGHARAVGFVAHLGAGQVFALLYAAGFAVLGWASWWLGTVRAPACRRRPDRDHPAVRRHQPPHQLAARPTREPHRA